MIDSRKVTICAVPYEMQIIDGGVLFIERSGFWGTHARYLWTYRLLWYLDISESSASWNRVAGPHLVKMHKLLEEMVRVDPANCKTQPVFKETSDAKPT